MEIPWHRHEGEYAQVGLALDCHDREVLAIPAGDLEHVTALALLALVRDRPLGSSRVRPARAPTSTARQLPAGKLQEAADALQLVCRPEGVIDRRRHAT